MEFYKDTFCYIHRNQICLIQNMLNQKPIFVCLCSEFRRKKYSCKETKKDCQFCRSGLKFLIDEFSFNNLHLSLLFCRICYKEINLDNMVIHFVERINPFCKIVPVATLKYYLKLQNLIKYLSQKSQWDLIVFYDNKHEFELIGIFIQHAIKELKYDK